MTLQGLIRSMPEFKSHIRAGVIFPRDGREFVVDPKLFDEAAKEAKAIYDEAHREGRVNFEHPDKPVVYHVAEKDESFLGVERMRTVEKRGRLIDLPGQPLILDPIAYEYLRQAFGTHLVCEPLGGVLDPMASAARVTALEAENARLKARIAELEKPAKK